MIAAFLPSRSPSRRGGGHSARACPVRCHARTDARTLGESSQSPRATTERHPHLRVDVDAEAARSPSPPPARTRADVACADHGCLPAGGGTVVRSGRLDRATPVRSVVSQPTLYWMAGRPRRLLHHVWWFAPVVATASVSASVASQARTRAGTETRGAGPVGVRAHFIRRSSANCEMATLSMPAAISHANRLCVAQPRTTLTTQTTTAATNKTSRADLPTATSVAQCTLRRDPRGSGPPSQPFPCWIPTRCSGPLSMSPSSCSGRPNAGARPERALRGCRA